jgi:hypothetical protein
MIPLEKQVCNLEPSKRLKELGVKQESEFYWMQVATPDKGWGQLTNSATRYIYEKKTTRPRKHQDFFLRLHRRRAGELLTTIIGYGQIHDHDLES